MSGNTQRSARVRVSSINLTRTMPSVHAGPHRVRLLHSVNTMLGDTQRSVSALVCVSSDNLTRTMPSARTGPHRVTLLHSVNTVSGDK